MSKGVPPEPAQYNLAATTSWSPVSEVKSAELPVSISQSLGPVLSVFPMAVKSYLPLNCSKRVTSCAETNKGVIKKNKLSKCLLKQYRILSS